MLTNIKKILYLGTPLIIGPASEFLLYIVDTVMIGQLGLNYLAAIGVATLFAEIMWAIIWPMSPITQGIITKLHGGPIQSQADQKAIGSVLQNALIVAFSLGCIAFLLASQSYFVLSRLYDDPLLISLAESYITLVKWSIPLGALFYTFYGFFSGVKLTKILVITSIELNALNIIFDYILIYGKFGFPAMGIEGAAIGTLLANLIVLLHIALYMILSKKTQVFSFLRKISLQTGLLIEILKGLIPLVLQGTFIFFIYLLYESIASKSGVQSLAITHILLMLLEFSYIAVAGFSTGASILIGNCLGSGDKLLAIRYVYANTVISVIIGLIFFTSVFIYPDFFIGLFNSAPEIILIGTPVLQSLSIILFISAIGFSIEIIFSHNGYGSFVLWTEIISCCILLIGLSLVLTTYFNSGIAGVWLCLGLYTLFRTGGLFGGLIAGKWLNA